MSVSSYEWNHKKITYGSYTTTKQQMMAEINPRYCNKFRVSEQMYTTKCVLVLQWIIGRFIGVRYF
jgi:hypothetical protein